MGGNGRTPFFHTRESAFLFSSILNPNLEKHFLFFREEKCTPLYNSPTYYLLLLLLFSSVLVVVVVVGVVVVGVVVVGVVGVSSRSKNRRCPRKPAAWLKCASSTPAGWISTAG